jgi:hypothetical protein
MNAAAISILFAASIGAELQSVRRGGRQSKHRRLTRLRTATARQAETAYNCNRSAVTTRAVPLPGGKTFSSSASLRNVFNAMAGEPWNEFVLAE